MTRTSDEEMTLLGSQTPHSGALAPAAAALPPGAKIGRYILSARIGAGVMGVVHAAYDPELDRKVALKLLYRRSGDEDVVREATALAKLNHPNVVAVYDVGRHDDRVWIAMELVEGVTLRARIDEAPLPWRAVVDIMEQVARGLRSAHLAGLIHRDVKPDNVMLGADGRVRVMDFGIARVGVSPLDSKDARAGTPAYMAAEQHAGLPTDVRTDVFAWSVTLWEALYGVRPFAADNLFELVAAVTTSRVREAPRNIRAPRWLRDLVRRGLHAEAARRWPDFSAILTAVERGRTRARWRRLTVVGLAVVSLAAIPAAKLRYDEAKGLRACELEAEAVTAVWNPEARDRILATLPADAHYRTGFEHTERWFDDFASTWTELRMETCVAELAQPGDTHNAHVTECLAERLSTMAAAADVLASADLGGFAYTPGFVIEALDLGGCRDGRADIRAQRPADDALRSDIDAARRQLIASQALSERGKFDDALNLARQVHARAETLGWPPLVHESAFRVGRQMARRGDPVGAGRWIETAAFGALAEGEDELTQTLALAMTAVWLDDRGNIDEARRWMHLATRLCSRLGLDGSLDQATVLSAQARLARNAAGHEEALAADQAALAIRERWLGPGHPLIASSWNSLSADYAELGDPDEAVAAAERAFEIRRAALGDAHPDVLQSLINLGVTYSRLGALDLAKDVLAEAIALGRRTLGPRHPLVATADYNLATAHFRLKEFETTTLLTQDVVELREQALGPAHPAVAEALNNLAGALILSGRCDDAMAAALRALEIRRARLAPGDPEIAQSLSALGSVRSDCKRSREALLPLEQALLLIDSDAGETLHVARLRLGLALSRSGLDPWRGRAFVRMAAQQGSGKTREDAEDWLRENPPI